VLRTVGLDRLNESRLALASVAPGDELSFGTMGCPSRRWTGKGTNQARIGQVVWNEQDEETGHSPNMRYSGPQLLSSWLHVASAVSNQAAIPLAELGPLGPLS
jgi:hypothetical protein